MNEILNVLCECKIVTKTNCECEKKLKCLRYFKGNGPWADTVRGLGRASRAGTTRKGRRPGTKPAAARPVSAQCHSGCAGVAKMVSHAIFQYNVLVIDIDNTTLGLI